MSWTLAGVTIPKPQEFTYTFDIQEVKKRTLSGNYTKAYLGKHKRVINASWTPISVSDFNAIYSIYADQRDHHTNKLLVISELSISMNVHISLQTSTYNIKNNYDWFDFTIEFAEK